MESKILVNDRYRLDRRLVKGKYSVGFQGFDVISQQNVAVKLERTDS